MPPQLAAVLQSSAPLMEGQARMPATAGDLCTSAPLKQGIIRGIHLISVREFYLIVAFQLQLSLSSVETSFTSHKFGYTLPFFKATSSADAAFSGEFCGYPWI